MCLARWAAGAALALLCLGAACRLPGNVALAASTHQKGFFAATSYLNAPLTGHTPIDPHSGRMVGGLVHEVRAELARNYGPWINTSQYSTPIYTARKHRPGST